MDAGSINKLVELWPALHAALTGAFDTPLARLKDHSDYAEDARKRLREFNEVMTQARSDVQASVPRNANEDSVTWKFGPYFISAMFEDQKVGLLISEGSQIAFNGQYWPVPCLAQSLSDTNHVKE